MSKLETKIFSVQSYLDRGIAKKGFDTLLMTYEHFAKRHMDAKFDFIHSRRIFSKGDYIHNILVPI